jgi:hypothetical protein
MITTDVQQEVIINGFRQGDEVDILAMNLAEYGPRDIMTTSEAFHWRFAENPAGPAQITTARDKVSGKLIGFTWTIPIRMRLYGKDYLAALTANQLIQPEYRATLAYAQMSRSRMKLLRQQGIPFRYNFPTKAIFASAGSVEKMSSFVMPLLVYPLDPTRLAQMRFSRRWLALLFGLGAKAVIPMLFAGRLALKKSDPLIIEQLDRFDERFDVFWERIKDKYAIMTVRDQAFLTWRFAPVAGHMYHILAAMTGDELVGYTVVRITDEIRGIPSGLIMDLLLDPGPLGDYAGRWLLAEAGGYFQTEKVWIAGALALPNTSEYSVLRMAGYRSIPDRWMPRLFRVAFNCFGSDLPETNQVKESDLFMTIADYEAH